VTLEVRSRDGLVERIVDARINVSDEYRGAYKLINAAENYAIRIYETGTNLLERAQNTLERAIFKIKGLFSQEREIPVAVFMVHFEQATADIDLGGLMGDVDLAARKSFFYMPSWPPEIEESKVLYIPSTGVGTVYICPDVTSLDEVNPENPNRVVINVGETVNGMTVSITHYEGEEYYIVSGITGSGAGGGEATWIERPDLAISAPDIHFSNDNPVLGEDVTINATIHNIGEADAIDAIVGFYDGEPETGTIIGWDTINVPAAGVANASVIWNAAIPGSHEICVLTGVPDFPLDKDSANNMACRSIHVRQTIISGRVIDYNENPVSDAFVQALGPDQDSTFTDINGVYSFAGLKPGDYTVTVTPSPYANLMSTSREVSISAGEVITLNFTLEPAGSIGGAVTDGGEPVPDVILYLTGYETPRYRTDENGQYIIGGLEAGSYTLNIYAPDYEEDWRIFVNGEHVKDGTSVDIDVVLGATTRVDFRRGIFQCYLPIILKTYTPPIPTWTTGTGLSGRTAYGLAIDPNNCDVLYAGTDAGIYKTTNCGQSWTATGLNALTPKEKGPRFERGPSLRAGTASSLIIPALATHPSNSQVVYAATWGGGVYKTTNSGGSWSQVNNGLEGHLWLYALAIAPNGTTLYAGTTDSGVYKTTNGGSSWSPVNNGLANLNIRSLAINPANSQVVYAGTMEGGVYKTTNGGSSWSPANSGMGNRTVWVLAINPANPQVVYAGTDNGVYKTTDGGSSWTRVGLSGKTVLGLVIDPLNAQTVYAGTDGSGVYQSTNAGASWAAINEGLGSLAVQVLALDPSSCRTLHAGTADGVWEYRP
jgi:photosystem II stability/assembly factor-like uncharacterized protein